MHLQDLQIYSAYGFDENDIAAIKKQEFVESCFPSRMADVMCRDGHGDSRVIRLEELDRSINGYVLVEGRLPEKEDEIAVVRGSGLKIGEKITVYLDDDDIEEIIRNTEFTVVGTVKTPSYMTTIPGSSTYKNMDLNAIGYVFNSNFIRE